MSATYSNGLLVERTVDHGNGTATRTTYNPDGTVASTETLTVPLPDPRDAVRAGLEAKLAVLVAEATAAKATIQTGRGLLTTIRTTPQATVANLATLQALQTQLKSAATVMDGALDLESKLIDRTVAIARITVGAYDEPVEP